MRASTVLVVLSVLALGATSANAAQFIYRSSITLKVGQTAILKGIRGTKCGHVDSWKTIEPGLPHSSLGKFLDGGLGTVLSNACGGLTPARGLKFEATRKGQERLTVLRDPFSITVQ